jgi:TolB-like protein/DNA-binding winged helix-turn-helix (wHTH) protein/Tfp pilus assembly protein PilF
MVARFEDFELDLDLGELRRKGSLVKLERIPMQLLCLLVSGRGEVLTRVRIIDALWGKDTYMDTDNGINTAIRKVRVALRDKPEAPRLISTVPGRGYRFTGVLLEEPSAALAPASQESPPATPSGSELSGEVVASGPRSRTPRSIWWIASVCLVLIASASLYFARRARSTSAPTGRVMLAVLPFQNLSGDPAQDYFVDGMTEEMITQLGGLSPQSLGVIARTSTMQYKASGKSVSEIARELGVDYVLEGSVRRTGDRFRVTAQLIQAKDQTHLWARDYDRRITDVVDIQSAISSAIANEIRIVLPASATAQPAPAPVSEAAHDAYLRGMYYFDQRARAALTPSIEAFTEATSLDPQYASAWAGLGRAYSIAPVFELLPSDEAIPKARNAALRAIELNGASAVAHSTLGFVLAHFDHDWPGAEREFQHAIALNPSDPYSHFFYSNSLLSPEGRHDEAIAEMQSAISLDPYSFPFNSFFGRTLLWAGRPQEALTQLNKADQIRPNSAINHERVAHLYSSLGRYDDAISEEEKSRILDTVDPEAGMTKARKLRAAYFGRGTRGYWEEELELTYEKDNPPEFYHGAYGRAIIYAQLGEPQKAMEALNQALTEHDMRMTELDIEPLFKPLCSESAFSDLKKKIGLNPKSPPVAVSSR